MASGGGGSPAMSGIGGSGIGLVPGFILSQILGGQGQKPQGGGMPSFGGGMIGNPSVGAPFMSAPQQGSGGHAPQYNASPAAQNQIQSLLSGTAGGGMSPSGLGALTSFGKYSGALTPGIQAAMGAGGSGVPGGGNPQYGGTGALLGGLPGMMLGNMFEKNNSQIQDIAGALYQGLPITNQDWARAGFGPGGIPLGGK